MRRRLLRKAEQNEPLLVFGVSRVGRNASERVGEDGRRFLERNSLFREILRCLLQIPFKP
jgi:hypothetical protein